MNRRTLFVLLLSVGVLAGAPWALTQAVWTDAQAVPGNTFSTGSVDISTSPTSALVTLGAMVPGDKVTAPLTVSNDGTLQLRYAMATSISGSTALSNGLELQIKSGVTACTNAGFDANGSNVYATGTLTAGAIGNPAQGNQSGDRVLDTGQSDVLCFQVRLPSAASPTLQGLSTTATFTFTGEQTTNNP